MSLTVVSGGAFPAGTVAVTASLGAVLLNWRSMTTTYCAFSSVAFAFVADFHQHGRERHWLGTLDTDELHGAAAPEEVPGLRCLADDHPGRIVGGAPRANRDEQARLVGRVLPPSRRRPAGWER